MTVEAIAEELGLSKSTVERAQRSALAKLARAYAAPSRSPSRTVTLTMLEIVYLCSHDVQLDYLARLMRCRPGDAPEAEPPPGL